MPNITVRGLALEYDSQGPANAPAILLIMGLGAHYTRWPQALCTALVNKGYRVIRFDNRDCGLSGKCEDAFIPDLRSVFQGGGIPLVPYTLEDMADDAVGLLDGLGITQAHIVGASMGAAIAQILAARHPERCLSLTSMMSTSGNPMLPPPTPAAAMALFAPLPFSRDKAAIVDDAIRRYQALCSPAYPPEPAALRQMFETEFERCFYPQGVARQMGAIVANGDRRPLLRTLHLPCHVLHGGADPLIQPPCGEDVARNIPGATWQLVPGMGHDFPAVLCDTFAEAIDQVARRAKL